MSKTYKSSLFKRIIDLGVVREAEVDDLVRIWRVGTGDEKAITLENFVQTVNEDLGSGGLTLTEVIAAIEEAIADLPPAVTIGTPANGLSIDPTSQVLSLGLSSASTIGALNSTDWSTFNSKIGGSGTVNYVPKFTGDGTIGDSRLIDNGVSAYFANQGNSTHFGNGAGLADDFSDNRAVSFGFQSARSASTAAFYASVGYQAGEKNTSGLAWSAYGYQAGFNNTSGNNWTAIGFQAGLSNTTGQDWVALGRDAGGQNQSGGLWTALGRQAAVSYVGGAVATSFSTGVYIGALTRVGIAGAANEIVIGYLAEGGGSNTVVIGNSSIVSNRLYGTLRIGTISNLGTSPAEVLVPSATGVVSKRTLAELGTDLGAVLTTGDQSIAGIKTFTTQVSVTGSFLSLSALPDNRSKIRLFGTSFEYGIGTQSATTFGRLNDTAVTFNVPNTDARGWLWGDSGHTLPSQGSMSLTSNGNLTVANSLRLGYGESDTDDVVAYGFDHNGTARLAGIPSGTIVDTLGLDVNNQVVKGAGGGGISGLTTNRIPKATSATTIGDSILVSDGNGLYNTGKGNSTFFGFGAGLNDDGSDNANTFVGYDAGRNNTTGSGNTAIGKFALKTNITGNDNTIVGYHSGLLQTGGNNSFFGRGTGQSTTTGNNNSFFGRLSGGGNTTGSGNSFFGSDAGYNNTTGINNSFFGRSSGIENTTGGANCFFGEQAGRANTTGSANSFFGIRAGEENTTGFLNSFFGGDAGQSNTTGVWNSFFGQSSGQNTTTGNDNCFFGGNSGTYNTTGINNSFFGRSSGLNNTTGDNNSFFGRNSGSQSTTGSGNAFFGTNAGQFIADGIAPNNITNNSLFFGFDSKANADNQTNQIVIGYQAIGAGSNTVVLGNTSIIKTVLRGTINAANLPTSSAGLLTGDIWNDAGTLKIV